MGELLFIAVVPLLALALVRLLDGATARSPRREWFAGWLSQSKLWHVVVALGLSACLFLIYLEPHGPRKALPVYLTLLVLLALAVRAWRHEFLLLMALRDEDLPGRFDKLIWASVLLLVPPVGIWLFRSYREAHWPELAPVKGKPVSDFA